MLFDQVLERSLAVAQRVRDVRVNRADAILVVEPGDACQIVGHARHASVDVQSMIRLLDRTLGPAAGGGDWECLALKMAIGGIDSNAIGACQGCPAAARAET